MTRRNKRICVVLVGVLGLSAGAVSAQNVGRADQITDHQQSRETPVSERRRGISLACEPSQDARHYICYRDAPRDTPTIGQRVQRWLFRLFRDPIAVLTLFLFLIGGIQIEISRRNGNRQLRAYLYVSDFQLIDAAHTDSPGPDTINHPCILLQVANSGETPANDVFHHARLEVRPVAEESLLPILIPGNISRSYIARGGVITKTIWLGRQLAPQEVSGIQTGTHAIYVMGRIDYRDAFKRKRYTTYRLRYVGPYPPPVSGQQIVFCDDGNKAT